MGNRNSAWTWWTKLILECRISPLKLYQGHFSSALHMPGLYLWPLSPEGVKLCSVHYRGGLMDNFVDHTKVFLLYITLALSHMHPDCSQTISAPFVRRWGISTVVNACEWLADGSSEDPPVYFGIYYACTTPDGCGCLRGWSAEHLLTVFTPPSVSLKTQFQKHLLGIFEQLCIIHDTLRVIFNTKSVDDP